jgi:hypothetical protein
MLPPLVIGPDDLNALVTAFRRVLPALVEPG